MFHPLGLHPPNHHLNLNHIDISTLYTILEPGTRYAQTLAVVEILHAATGNIIS